MLDEVIDNGLVRTRLRGLRPEASLLLALARPRLTASAQERIRAFLAASAADLDWGWFVDQASRHGVLPLAGRNLIKHRLVHSADGRTLAPYRWIYSYAYEGNRRRNIALSDEYGKVIRGLNAAGLAYAIRKGPVLTEGVYRDPGSRRMGDLDVLLRPGSLPEFAAMVGDIGYEQGHLSGNAERVVPFDRETQLTWRVALANSALPFLKPAQRDDVEVFVLDPCFSLFQPRSGIKADSGDFLARARDTTAFGEPSRMLDPVDQVIDSCVQVHVEATTLMYIEMGKDLMLLKFLDLAELLRRLSAEERGTLSARAREYGVGGSAFYALHHAALLYPDAVAPELVAGFDQGDPDFLDLYGLLDNHQLRWDRSFAERLFDARRGRSLTVHSTVPGPRAIV
jgi:Uncharacterised nucleotidyltransferase